ncbi:DNA polymerase III subunit delta [Mycoplasmopsis alligatoris]|uniref:DNA polymerase III, delta' subunit n=1 Tax=Mycoplasmopsis alligatoris A21JP2 TaxID=747682 RepID=D4XWN2_9BACT|nr:DNA polymerase III subunit delta [Mycoplasmopsis alligatoris]EFF41128.1 hypothetical protein MALL_0396 [Mycoplasmopsis alligatoris A21JP2]
MLNNQLTKVIDKIFENNKVAHCYLFNSINNSNVDDALLYFVNAANKTNLETLSFEEQSNIFYVEINKGKMIKKEEILDAFENIDSTIQQLNKYKIVIIKNVELCSINAINSVLKIIEEPIKNTLILLSTNNVSRVLPTVKSRSMLINVFSDSFDVKYTKFLSLTRSRQFSLALSNAFSDEMQAHDCISDNMKKIVYDLIDTVDKSWVNRYKLYIFLTLHLNLDTKEQNIFILKTLCYLFKLLITSSQNQEELRVIKKLNKKEFNLPKNTVLKLNSFIYDVNNFITNIDSNASFMLQKEVLLEKLMGYYD